MRPAERKRDEQLRYILLNVSVVEGILRESHGEINPKRPFPL